MCSCPLHGNWGPCATWQSLERRQPGPAEAGGQPPGEPPDTRRPLPWEKPLRSGGCHCAQPGVGGLAMTSALPPGPCASRGARPPLPGPPRVSHCVTPDKPLGPSDPHLPYLPSRVYMVVGGGQPLRCREGHGPLPVPLPGDTVHLCEHSCLLLQTQAPEGSRPTPPCLEQGFGAQRVSQREGAHVLSQITQGRPSWTCRPGAPCPGPRSLALTLSFPSHKRPMSSPPLGIAGVSDLA